MESRVKVLGHAIHPMLIPFPLGLLAAPFGWIDWFKIPEGTRAKGIGLVHGLGNIVVVVLFAVSWVLRAANSWEPTAWALVCSFAAVALAVVTAWMGGELVERLG